MVTLLGLRELNPARAMGEARIRVQHFRLGTVNVYALTHRKWGRISYT